MMSEWEYKVYINGELVRRTPFAGLAWLAFESAKLLGYAVLEQVYVGDSFDPVIHHGRRWAGGIMPPCPSLMSPCPWRKSLSHEFYTACRPTALRCEVVEPQDRCGYLLKPNAIGGSFYDYGPCIAGRGAGR